MLTNVLGFYKQAYSGLSRYSWYLSVVMLVNRTGTMVMPFMSIYCINKLHFTIVQAGIIMTMFGIGATAGVIAGGKINGKIGFYYLQIASLLCGGLLFIVLSFQHSFISVCIVSFLLSLFNEAFRPANSTAIAHFSADENRARSYSLNRLAVNLGWAAGGALGGFLASVNYSFLFWADGITNILAALLLLRLIPKPDAATIAQLKNKAVSSFAAYKDLVFVAFTVLSTLFSICFFLFIIMQPLFYKVQWHFNEVGIGALLAFNGLLIVLFEMVLVHALEKRSKRLVCIIAGVLFAGFGYGLYNLLPAGYASAIVIVILVSVGEMLGMPFMNTFWISRATASNRGSYVALYSLSWTSAQIIAPIYGSFLISYGGFNLLWWMLAVVSCCTAVGFMCVRTKLDSKSQIT
jgi:predicted MFS family arabinose efflux permease